ncbi:Spermidine export protein MdtJ [Vibrio stylophorae]|uniref:Spermidine export protein MdtJ n=1 Tax=Vibrio stylophorae TaxID=659351 RepID=A0ABM8ZX80_9VIBR|nr:SMR family transporter [Vibrio stylophorae]CAH0535286.1 Spermidine export protein MdtJ [Vibrio stylophorae]
MLLARLFLLIAITAEVAGTSTLNMVHGAWWGYGIMYTLIAVSYYFLSLSIKKIAVGVAYALWEGLGICMITLLSILFLDADLSGQQLFGLMLAVIGIVCVTLGEHHDKATPSQKNKTPVRAVRTPSTSNARALLNRTAA